ncbi:MAG: type II toxin-antitoxin system HicB family antitoxin [Caldilinea sp. CFX5]|nr:type II toxin-antitoxin system HicB family antitoxin [Caldilinea sp. CFX5]
MTNPTDPHTYDILVEKSTTNGYIARVIAWPDCTVEAPTRAAALAQIRSLILERLAKAEIVTLAITPEEMAHPWLPFAGDWADDPGIEDFRAAIEAHRRELDAQWSPWLFEPETSEVTQIEPTREAVAV